ncbi:YbaB/EbfC family nucleoid-associated protein [Amycolatopsis sp. NPDC003676]
MSDPLSNGTGDRAAQVDQWVARAKEKAQRYQEMQSAIGRVSVTESSRDGLVTVTVDSAGNATDLRITDKVRELSGEQVATAVLTAMRRAQARLPERLGEVMTETIGDDRDTIDTVVGRYREKFPEPEPETPAPPADPASRQSLGQLEEEPPPPTPSTPKPKPPSRPKDDSRGDDGDEGFEDRSFLTRG